MRTIMILCMLPMLAACGALRHQMYEGDRATNEIATLVLEVPFEGISAELVAFDGKPSPNGRQFYGAFVGGDCVIECLPGAHTVKMRGRPGYEKYTAELSFLAVAGRVYEIETFEVEAPDESNPAGAIQQSDSSFNPFFGTSWWRFKIVDITHLDKSHGYLR